MKKNHSRKKKIILEREYYSNQKEQLNLYKFNQIFLNSNIFLQKLNFMSFVGLGASNHLPGHILQCKALINAVIESSTKV